MNLKEVSELRRRFRMDRNAISRIYGCFVNSSREIVSYIDESMGILPQDEAEKYLNLLKKALSGKLGKNLIDIIFSTEQVADSDEHRLLMALRDSQLKDGEIREELALAVKICLCLYGVDHAVSDDARLIHGDGDDRHIRLDQTVLLSRTGAGG